jgi:hypothetical protein
MNPHLARIRLFPLKSLDGQDVAAAAVLRAGALAHDREYCFQDEEGSFVNGKRAGEQLLKIRSTVDFGFGRITLSDENGSAAFVPHREGDQIESWVGERVGRTVRLAHDADGGFPDDAEAPGPTIVSKASLEAVGSWFGLSVDEVRLRFRANLEVDGVPAFWEDRLFGPDGETVRFRIGDVLLEGVNPCARCAVPGMDPTSGKVSRSDFAKVFAERRREALPAWAEPGRFDHYYRLAVNTRIPESEAGKVLEVGDSVDVVG